MAGWTNAHIQHRGYLCESEDQWRYPAVVEGRVVLQGTFSGVSSVKNVLHLEQLPAFWPSMHEMFLHPRYMAWGAKCTPPLSLSSINSQFVWCQASLCALRVTELCLIMLDGPPLSPYALKCKAKSRTKGWPGFPELVSTLKGQQKEKDPIAPKGWMVLAKTKRKFFLCY